MHGRRAVRAGGVLGPVEVRMARRVEVLLGVTEDETLLDEALDAGLRECENGEGQSSKVRGVINIRDSTYTSSIYQASSRCAP